MTEIVNLKRARKAKDRRAAEDKAAQNRAHFGVPKSERAHAKALRDKTASTMDSHKLDGDDG